jgi:endonuclease III
VSKKSDLIKKLVKQVELPHDLPSAEFEGTLLEAGMYTALLKELPESRAKSAISGLRKAFTDYNETRVSQYQEIAEALAPKGKGLHRLDKYLPAARSLKAFLQAVFQETHGLDLEPMKDDPVGIGRSISSVDSLGNALASYLLYQAEEGKMPVLSGSVRVLDRLNVMTRTSSVRKAREALDKLIPAKERLAVSYALGLVVDRWCDSRKPTCWECALIESCTYGQKVKKDWIVQQERLAKQRDKEEERAALVAEKEEARLARESERETRLRAVTLKKITKERDKAAKVAAKKAEIEKKRKDAERKKAAEKKKAADRKVAERKQAVVDKKKDAADKKKAQAVTKREAAAKRRAAKNPVGETPVAKKAPAKKAPTKKTSAKKAPAKKAPAKKAAAKKPAAKKAPAKKAPAKKKVSKKAPAKKAASKKASTKKKATPKRK